MNIIITVKKRGGNCLHCLNVATPLGLSEVRTITKVKSLPLNALFVHNYS